jgi:hypothetical protein
MSLRKFYIGLTILVLLGGFIFWFNRGDQSLNIVGKRNRVKALAKTIDFAERPAPVNELGLTVDRERIFAILDSSVLTAEFVAGVYALGVLDDADVVRYSKQFPNDVVCSMLVGLLSTDPSDQKWAADQVLKLHPQNPGLSQAILIKKLRKDGSPAELIGALKELSTVRKIDWYLPNFVLATKNTLRDLGQLNSGNKFATSGTFYMSSFLDSVRVPAIEAWSKIPDSEKIDSATMFLKLANTLRGESRDCGAANVMAASNLEKKVLESMDQNLEYGETGITVGKRIENIMHECEQYYSRIRMVLEKGPKLGDAKLDEYIERIDKFGQEAAMAWLDSQ